MTQDISKEEYLSFLSLMDVLHKHDVKMTTIPECELGRVRIILSKNINGQECTEHINLYTSMLDKSSSYHSRIEKEVKTFINHYLRMAKGE